MYLTSSLRLIRNALCGTTLAASLLTALPAHAFDLISEDEAKLPAGTAMITRGITRGPAVRQIQPEPNGGPIKSPLALKIAFEPRGGARIDPASVRLTYLKATPVDLSERVRQGVSDRGLELQDAEIPPGEHELQLTLQDTDGRKTSHTIRLVVAR